jgi:hypothetical protein
MISRESVGIAAMLAGIGLFSFPLLSKRSYQTEIQELMTTPVVAEVYRLEREIDRRCGSYTFSHNRAYLDECLGLATEYRDLVAREDVRSKLDRIKQYYRKSDKEFLSRVALTLPASLGLLWTGIFVAAHKPKKKK